MATCLICKGETNTPKNHKVVNNETICDKCNKKIQKEKIEVKCSECGKQFKTIKDNALNVVEYYCEACG